MENNTCGAVTELPKYKCHKEVWALKIKQVVTNPDGGWVIIPEEKGYAQFDISNEYYEKHKPEIGGYYVVYKGGYKSFSPAIAFEEGYSLVK